MNKITALLALAGLSTSLAVQAQTSIFLETFNGGAADWADVNYAGASQVGSGGHNGGAFLRVDVDIDSSGGGAQGLGGYTAARCADNPSQAPSLNCSGGNFVGDWYFTDGVQELKMWFRHDSAKSGGIIPQIRIAVPGNTPGASAIFPAVPANTWTLLTVPLDLADPIWDPAFGAIIPDATAIFRNVNRIQLGYFIDPNESTYVENNVNFDIDDVEILGSTPLTAVIVSRGQIHPHHFGQKKTPSSCCAQPDDNVRARVLGALTSVGDPADIVTANIVQSTVRIGPIGGAAHTRIYPVNEDGDGIDDVEFRASNSDAIANTTFPPYPSSGTPVRCITGPFGDPLTKLALRAELTTGEVISGEDLTLNVNCDAACHTN